MLVSKFATWSITLSTLLHAYQHGTFQMNKYNLYPPSAELLNQPHMVVGLMTVVHDMSIEE